MKNNLHLIRKPLRLSCTWIPTGNLKRTLACVWVEAGAPRAGSTASADSEAGGVCLCA
jgi:hypothetical protein